MSMIKTVGLTKQFGTFVANNHINLTVEPQEIRCIVGENGAGKTTLMNMLYGLIPPTSGDIYLRDERVVLKSPLDAIDHGLGMVHQHFKLVPSLTVYENILLGTELMHSQHSLLIDREREIQVIGELIDRYNFKLTPTDNVEDISVGERQCVEILKMLYRNVDILILDEPTAVLTPQEVDDLIINLRSLRDEGKTIIMITHKLREVMQLSDSVTVLRRGTVIGDVRTCDTTNDELAKMMVGHEVTQAQNNSVSAEISSVISYAVRDVSTVNSSGKHVLDHVSFQVHGGEILGIAGVEGNGQSELVKVLTGMMTPTSGQIELQGTDITDWWPDALRDQGVGIICEDRYAEGLCSTMSIADNCIAGYQGRPDVCHHGLLDRKAMRKKRDTYTADYDIRISNPEGDVGALSGGNAQKLIVARELEHNPLLLIACQPTRGVDIGSAEFVRSKILEFRSSGRAVLLISSELSEVVRLSDRIIVMYKGGIVGEVNPRTTSRTQLGLLMAGVRDEDGEYREA